MTCIIGARSLRHAGASRALLRDFDSYPLQQGNGGQPSGKGFLHYTLYPRWLYSMDYMPQFRLNSSLRLITFVLLSIIQPSRIFRDFSVTK